MSLLKLAFFDELEKLAARRYTQAQREAIIKRFASGSKKQTSIPRAVFNDWYAHHSRLQNPGHPTSPSWWRRGAKKLLTGIGQVMPSPALRKPLESAGRRVWQGGVSPERTIDNLKSIRSEAQRIKSSGTNTKKSTKKEPSFLWQHKGKILLGVGGLAGYAGFKALQAAKKRSEEE